MPRQELFNKLFFSSELSEYEDEGVVLPPFSAPDNTGCVDLLERPGGIISLLDQETPIRVRVRLRVRVMVSYDEMM